MRFAAFCYLVLCALYTSLGAQPRSGDTSLRRFGFTTYSWGEAVSDLKYRHGEELVPLLIPNGTRSAMYEYAGEMPMRFYRDTGKVDAEGNPVYEIAAELAVPSNLRNVLIVFIESSEREGKYLAAALDDSTDGFPANSIKLVNFSKKRIAFRLGEEVTTMEAGREKILPFKSPEGESQAIMIAFYRADGTLDLEYNRRWFVYPNSRLLAFITDDGSEDLKIRRLRDNMAHLRPQSTP